MKNLTLGIPYPLLLSFNLDRVAVKHFTFGLKLFLLDKFTQLRSIYSYNIPR